MVGKLWKLGKAVGENRRILKGLEQGYIKLLFEEYSFQLKTPQILEKNLL